jgi:hypothetical protein
LLTAVLDRESTNLADIISHVVNPPLDDATGECDRDGGTDGEERRKGRGKG